MLRTIFLVDMNAFFISCEMTRNPDLAGKPAAVAGDTQNRTGIILAANYPARTFGVRSAMVVHEALTLCPEMKLVPPDHDFYAQKSTDVMKLLSCYTPVVEQNSVDEAWLDMTGCEKLFGIPEVSSKRIMDNILSELGLWCSIGISENKFLAKMASEMKKPLGITQLWKKDISLKLWPLPLLSMQGIGKQTAKKLHDLGIETIGDLAHYPTDLLTHKFGKLGTELHNLANGVDTSLVVPHAEDEMKSIGRSITLPEDITDIELAKVILMGLAEEVGMVARKHEKKGRTVQITIKYSNFELITRQVTIPSTYLTKHIMAAGIRLLKQHWISFRPVRLLGISLSGFSESYNLEQISLFDLPKMNDLPSCKDEKIEQVMDQIRNKYGSTKISRAILLNQMHRKRKS